jgi:hypothetical protein
MRKARIIVEKRKRSIEMKRIRIEEKKMMEQLSK